MSDLRVPLPLGADPPSTAPEPVDRQQLAERALEFADLLKANGNCWHVRSLEQHVRVYAESVLEMKQKAVPS